MEVVLQGAVGDELVDEHPVVLRDAVADEGDEVAVVHAADDLHLRLELALPLPAAGLELLHGHALAVGQPPLVHAPEPALADHVVPGEVARDARQLLVAEGRLGPRRLHAAGLVLRPRRRREACRCSRVEAARRVGDAELTRRRQAVVAVCSRRECLCTLLAMVTNELTTSN